MFKYVRLILATFSFMVCASCLPMTNSKKINGTIVQIFSKADSKYDLTFKLKPMWYQDSLMIELTISHTIQDKKTELTQTFYYTIKPKDASGFDDLVKEFDAFVKDIQNIDYIKNLQQLSELQDFKNQQEVITKELNQKFKEVTIKLEHSPLSVISNTNCASLNNSLREKTLVCNNSTCKVIWQYNNNNSEMVTFDFNGTKIQVHEGQDITVSFLLTDSDLQGMFSKSDSKEKFIVELIKWGALKPTSDDSGNDTKEAVQSSVMKEHNGKQSAGQLDSAKPLKVIKNNAPQQSSWYAKPFVRYASMAAVAGVVAFAGWKLLNKLI